MYAVYLTPMIFFLVMFRALDVSAQGDSAVRKRSQRIGSPWVTGPKRRACFSPITWFLRQSFAHKPTTSVLGFVESYRSYHPFSLVMLRKTSRSKISFPPCDEISLAETLCGIIRANTTKIHRRKSLVSISLLGCHRIPSPNRNPPRFTAERFASN